MRVIMAWAESNSSEIDNYALNVLDDIDRQNSSHADKASECQALKSRQELENELLKGYCETSWDMVLCWPSTPPGTLAVLPCMDEFNGILYDSSQNATRWCWPNGTWEISNYNFCSDVVQTATEAGVEITTMLYFIGYSISLFTLMIAVFIFVYCKELRCLRNNIHGNLMFTYIMAELMWIVTTLMELSTQRNKPTCIILFSLLHYFHLTNFFWMFVEGLYLYLLVVKTFTGDNIKLRFCLAIGWGMPMPVIAIWGIAKSLDHNIIDQSNQAHRSLQDVALWRHCSWMIPHPYDWIYQGPTILVLAVNVIFLFMIMWVLITKLWSANNVETQQYRKASKALLVLIPLLGVTYMLVLIGPSEGQAANAFSYARAILLSSQGFFVALFYCFFNTEVQNTVRHHFARWSTARDLGNGQRFCNNWSRRSRTESIRLYCQPSNPYHKRESTVSETTMTTVIGPNSMTPFLDKSKKVICEGPDE